MKYDGMVKSKGPNELPLRLITRESGRESWCEVFRGFEKAVPDNYILCHDANNGELFIASQRMGAWMEVDMYEIHYCLNNKGI